MENTILQDVKKSIGINPDVEDLTFDDTIVIHINSAIAELAELGLGHVGDFTLENKSEVWSDYLTSDYQYLLPLVKPYICAYVRLAFDPPQSGSLATALKEQQDRLEFRIQIAIEVNEGGKEHV